MKYLLVVLCLISVGAVGQDQVKKQIEELIKRNEAEAHLTFLASDEMRGRDTGSPELHIAANYLRTQFQMLNLKPAPGTDNYFQPVDLIRYQAPAKGTVVLGDEKYTLLENMVVLEGEGVEWSGEFVYVGYGAAEDLERLDLKGKMVLALAGSRDADNINKVYNVSREKLGLVKKAGGVGLIEILAFQQVPWSALVNAFQKDSWSLSDNSGKGIPFIWLKPRDIRKLSFREDKNVKGSVSVVSHSPARVDGKNVAAWVEGTDPQLEDEYIILTAHYDHVGVDADEKKKDRIYNGARDNAVGTVALLQAGKFLAQNPPARSVLLIALTSEEKGLLGSKWYVKHPLVPLNKTILNLNCDGVGYNDITMITSISLGRTDTDELLREAAKGFGFNLGGDPDPREGFYERSDQVSFAKEGIPAIKLQPGVAKMDEEIFKYYHQPADEVSSINLDYINRFYRSYVYAVHLLANSMSRPFWVAGDKFEEAGKKLYGR